MKKKKIGIFTGYFLPHMGGVERYVDKISAALQKLGYDIVIVTSNDSDAKNYEKNDQHSIYRLPILNIVKKRYPIPRINAEYRKLIGKIEKESIDYFIVNTRFHLTSLIGAKLGKHKHKPVMLIEHGTAHFTVGNKVLDFFGLIYEHILTTRVKKYVDKFYGVSKNSNIWSRHFSIDANGVFYNAIDPRDSLLVKDLYSTKYPKNEIVITYAGRLIKQKGILNLLESFRKLKKLNNKQQLKLVVAGDGELLEMIKKKYKEKNIDILGRLDFEHVMALYKRTDIFVYPSLYPEGLPTSILEAGLMECAIIATPRGGTEEVIIDSEHGIIVDGSTESLYEAMVTLIEDIHKRKSQAKRVKKRIESHFNWDSVANQVDKEIKGFG
jgi:glycosyltransferase involved in cell wall biosynthesis